jgi:hypothetical protein
MSRFSGPVSAPVFGVQRGLILFAELLFLLEFLPADGTVGASADVALATVVGKRPLLNRCVEIVERAVMLEARITYPDLAPIEFALRPC